MPTRDKSLQKKLVFAYLNKENKSLRVRKRKVARKVRK